MKKALLFITAISFLIACGNKENPDKKQAKLEELKKQQAELAIKIKDLEAEIAAEGKTQDNTKYKNVLLTEASTQTFAHYLDIQGKIDAEENITISAKMPATVTRILVKAGRQVKTGELLAELDNSTIIAGIEELKTGMQLANTLYEKQKALWDQKIGTEVQYLQAKSQKESLDKKLATLYEQLDMTKIKSPINGTVDEVMLRIGQTTAPGAPGIRIVNMGTLKAKAEVAEAYAGRIKEGNEVKISFPDTKKEIIARVTYSGKVISAMNRSFTVEANLDGNQDLHPNMLAVLKIADYRNDSAIVVPINTVQNSEEGQYVMVAKQNGNKLIAKRRVVKQGLSYNGNAEIISGLNVGDKIITTGYQDLNQGDPIVTK
ncbi:MAG TPA: efflux RND transporter periplasmic adaptor subunit [Bacteroidia bacterium]|nr:efflux RND transporter periplasmic adaptor subunit [Bacteroidia bacterium]